MTNPKTLILAALVTILPSASFAQSSSNLFTATGHEINISFGHYNYAEPNVSSMTPISIHGLKIGGEYTGTWSMGTHRWFLRANARGTTGSVTYDGYCAPFLLVPNSGSPNGYQLDLGDFSPCSESGDKDWYVETRGLAGKDFGSQSFVIAPFAGVGYRHLSNGTTGTPGYRTDDYLYLPFGVTARTNVAAHALDLDFEYDYLLRGWQTTRDSALGGGNVPATPTAPAFTINGFTDVSFDQHSGWALRASAKYRFTQRWSVEPYYLFWGLADSDISRESVSFTVNGVTAIQEFGAFEPVNKTHEFGVKLGFRF
jgi:hypothetical protein